MGKDASCILPLFYVPKLAREIRLRNILAIFFLGIYFCRIFVESTLIFSIEGAFISPSAFYIMI